MPVTDDGPTAAFPMDRLPDDDLVDLCREGVEAAFRTIYDRHRRFLFSYALRLTGDRGTAAAALRETFAAFFGAIGTTGCAEPLNILLYRRIRERCLRPEEDAGAAGAAPVSAPLAAGTFAERVRSALDHLPATYREALYLRLIENRSDEEIAAIADVPEAVARTRAGNAAEFLRQAGRSAGSTARILSKAEALKHALAGRPPETTG